MRYWVDREFQDDGTVLNVMSIGLVAEDGREFSAVNPEFPSDLASDWQHRNTFAALPPGRPFLQLPAAEYRST